MRGDGDISYTERVSTMILRLLGSLDRYVSPALVCSQARRNHPLFCVKASFLRHVVNLLMFSLYGRVSTAMVPLLPDILRSSSDGTAIPLPPYHQ